MGTQSNPFSWSTFFSAQIGASAALAGLIFVAVSINLKQIVALPLLVGRSAKALLTLAGVLLTSTCCLVPGQPRAALAGELLGLGFILWIAISVAHRAAVRGNTFINRKQRIVSSLLTQLSLLPYLMAGASLLARSGGGLYWVWAPLAPRM